MSTNIFDFATYHTCCGVEVFEALLGVVVCMRLSGLCIRCTHELNKIKFGDLESRDKMSKGQAADSEDSSTLPLVKSAAGSVRHTLFCFAMCKLHRLSVLGVKRRALTRTSFLSLCIYTTLS